MSAMHVHKSYVEQRCFEVMAQISKEVDTLTAPSELGS